jgi:regulatory protein
MKITSILKQINQSDRYSIFVDEKYSFSLSANALLDSKIIRGQEISQQELSDFQKKSEDDKVYDQTLRFVALRPRTKAEVIAYLKKKNSPAPLVEQITNKLQTLNLINDAQFAQSFVNDRRLLRPTSRRKMIVDLRKKHVAKDVAEVIVGTSQEDERAALAAIVARKRRQSIYRDDVKLMQYLSRQGFSYNDIKAVVKGANETDYN